LPRQRKPMEVVSVARTLQLHLHGEVPELEDLARRFNAARIEANRAKSKSGTGFDAQKNALAVKYRLPSRIVNAVRISLDGMVSSTKEKALVDIASVDEKIANVEKVLELTEAKIAAKPATRSALRKLQKTLFHKTCSLERLQSRRTRLARRANQATPAICFGSRKLFNAQHHLKANGYLDHAAWSSEWRSRRSDEVLVVGSSDEVSGNQTCKASVEEDGAVSLTLGLGGNHGHLRLPNLRLAYGHDQWVERILSASSEAAVSKAYQDETTKEWQALLADYGEAWGRSLLALREQEFRAERRVARRAVAKAGSAIAYRFKRDGYGWRIFITITNGIRTPLIDYARGAIGLDLNDGHISRARVDAAGGLVDQHDIRMVMAGLSSGQRQAALHDIAVGLVAEAVELNVPLVVETLDFAMKKRRLKDAGCVKASRRLSSFAYSKFRSILASHALRAGIALVEVNPAYTSVMGAAFHAVPKGLTVHGAAAMVIARRAMSVEETVPTDGIRLWISGQKPQSLEIPVGLRSKALDRSSTTVWKGLSAAVRVAHGLAYRKRQTGHELRRLARQARHTALALADDEAFLRTAFA
jgi:IS605 OrfB family transposase